MIDYETKVKDWFLTHGYEINKIPETNKESPDFFITDDTSAYLLELKTKFPSEEEATERETVLSSGEIYNIDEIVTHKKSLSKIIWKAKSQLKNYDTEEDILKLVWLLAAGHLAEPRLNQFEATLYGSIYLYSIERYGKCYFFHNSDFFKYREVLDGAIISTESKGKLLLNPLSPRYNKMKGSSIIEHFKEGSIVDPIEIENLGQAFFVDAGINRADEQAVLEYLKQKYKIEKIAVVDTHYLSGTMDV